MPRLQPEDSGTRLLLPLAMRLADAARASALPNFRSAASIAENKAASGYDPVTEADRAAERAMRDILTAERPDDGIEGEEYGSSPGTSGLTWHLDPIDGTRAFIAGLPSWTVLIGLVEEGRPTLGVIDQPWLDERYIGSGGEAWLDCRGARTPLRVRVCEKLTDAILSTTDYFILTPPERGAFEHLRTAARLTRYGLDAYAYARLAAGTIDMVAETGLQSHDVAALIPVIEGAGGVVTDWRGDVAKLGGQIVAAANRKILDEALVSLRRSAL
ncbi:MAG: histidinol-phosphatase [Alphaproteobacteria bacterium]|nr:histidinol-phosphatase [Alphaproteobacteria bacterium]MDZ4762533.1 histidinol-phosphatase [Alphaproteobacteria bacterium]